MGTVGKDWTGALKNGDVEALWIKLYDLISKHSAIRMLCAPNEFTAYTLRDKYSDLTQDLFLHLHEKNRWQFYLDNGYTDEKIQQELYRIEVPNLVSRLQRHEHPESYRIARRISDLIQTRPEFKHYPKVVCGSETARAFSQTQGSNKMVLKLFGLSSWPTAKPVKPEAEILQSLENVAFRSRNIKRTGRGAGAQVIISNDDLTSLIVDVFTAIDTPLTIRRMRALVMSKLPIEDSQPVSIDSAGQAATDADADSPRLELPDDRPTPLECLLEKEAQSYIDQLAEMILEELKGQVRNKTKRYSKLVRIVWHCYFDPDQISQANIARAMGISGSLVSHYRSIFDSIIRRLDLSIDEFITLNNSLRNKLASLVSRFDSIDGMRLLSTKGMGRSPDIAALRPAERTLAKAASGSYS